MSDFAAILPAAILALGILAVIVTDLLGRGRRTEIPVTVALLALVAAAAAAWLGPRAGASETMLGVLRPDAFGVTLTVFCCVTGALTILATMRGEAFRRPGGEYLALILSAVLGMSVLSQATDLITLYLAFETVSIPSYVLVGMRRAERAANEASMKYVLFGAVSSGLMLYGISMIVGLSGGTSLEAVQRAVTEGGAAAQPIFLVSVLFVLAGFAFKISAVPFHFWSPDVYAGAPAAVGGFLAVASKAAGFAALVRVVSATIEVVPDAASPLATFAYAGNPLIFAIAIMAVLSMTVGNLAALRQTEIKRLLAWSSIAHAGYILLTLAVWSDNAAAALVIYLIAYLFMNLAAFLIAGIVMRERGTGKLTAFRGLGRERPFLGVAFAIVLFSLTGLPPFFGFVGKMTVFYAVFAKGYVWLGVIGLLNGALSLFYYAKVIRWMFLEETQASDVSESTETPKAATPLGFRPADGILVLALVAPIVVFGILWAPVWDFARSVVAAGFGGG